MKESAWLGETLMAADPALSLVERFGQASRVQRWTMVFMLSGITSLLLSLGFSSTAWEAWWSADEDWQQAHENLSQLEQKLLAQRGQIDRLRAQPHPAGFALPAWQTWPTDQTQDEQKVLQDWLAWGKKHGLQVQATRAESGQGTGIWEGRLPALLAAWHGLPQAVPRMVITGFECERMYPAGVNAVKWDDRQQDSGKLRLHMHWTVLRETTLSTSVIAKNTAHAHAKLQLPKTNDTHGTATTGKAFVYQPFGEQSLVSALPAQALSRQLWAHGLPSWQTQPLEALRWRGSASSGTRRLAWVASEGLVQAVKPGDRLGQDWGVVTAIEHDHLQLREWHADSQGQWVGQLRRFPEGHAR